MPTIIKKADTPLPNRRREKTGSRKILTLRPGRVWKSFEQFRIGGQSELAELEAGEMGQLITRKGSFRVMREDDFQQMYGLARDVERLQNGLRMVEAAVRSVRKHRDEETIEVLIQAVTLVDFPTLPTRDQFETFQPEGLEIDSDDDVELDPAALRRSLRGESEE
jgi:hypothetical protein